MKERKTILQKVPIIISVMTILLISLFAIDTLDSKLSMWEQFMEFLMHMVPSFILMCILVFIWRKQLIGGILFILIGSAGGLSLFQNNIGGNQDFIEAIIPPMVLAIPLIIAGSIFVFNHYRKKSAE